MKDSRMRELKSHWNRATRDILELNEIDIEHLRYLFKDTYILLKEYCKNESVPKELFDVLLEMKEWLEFTNTVQDSPYCNLEFYQQAYTLVYALLRGFSKGEFEDDIFEKAVDELNEKETPNLFALSEAIEHF